MYNQGRSMTKPVAFIGTRYGYDGIVQAAVDSGIPIAGWFDKYFYGNKESYGGYPILGSEDDITEEDKEKYDFFMASAYSGHTVLDNFDHNGMVLRKRRIELIKEKNLPLINLITPTAFVHETVELGKNIFIGHNVSIRAHVKIGDFCYFDQQAGIGEHSVFGENVIIMSQAVLSGDLILEPNSFVGLNATVANGYYGKKLVIGTGAKIAAGAVVYRDVEPDKFVSVEGRRMRKLDASAE